jgi:hypothetical protein
VVRNGDEVSVDGEDKKRKGAMDAELDALHPIEKLWRPF